ncbi:MAG: acyltransferase [Gammaproteobacteria bacterium]|jgi:peptidoglycan/LPS O-acetylase OafA/YrhL|nr:acyltransferase [Gammaproteobacteria bacterium]MBT3870105.1 acyltransferase [Gammaproteobacteria bacterium]MBT5199433.1 acyltransferase [Gammaproteobacteria bacterium]MBT7529521.1 acyltransferase [Gammaproteobacteria bacterium]
MVVAIHSRGGLWHAWAELDDTARSPVTAVFFALTRAGTEWVLVFFVLSGFLVGGRVAERVSNHTFDIKRYAIDRITRIFTPFIPALLWSALVACIIGGSVSWLEFAGNLIGLQGVFVNAFAGNFPLWSLAYEIWFYVLAGAVAFFYTESGIRRIFAGFTIVLALAIFTKLSVVFLFTWLIGGATYWLLSKPRNRLMGWSGFILAGIGYILSQLTSETVSIDLSLWQQFMPSNDVAILILALGIALCLPVLSHWRPVSLVLQAVNRAGAGLAAFSYTLYLTHYPLLYLWEYYFPERYTTLGGDALAVYILRIASCVLFAWLLYLPFERQTGKLRGFLGNR